MTTKKRRRPLTEQTIKADTSVSKRTREALDAMPLTELRPLELTTWVRKLVVSLKEDGEDKFTIDFMMPTLIRIFAKHGNYSKAQIDAIIYYFKRGYYDK
jgi:hypothetical protein